MVLPLTEDMSLYREHELALLARAGDERAFTLLVALCEPMLRAQVARFRFPAAEVEDMQQEGLLGLLSAVRTFDPLREVSFRTYASACVRNRLLSILRRRAARATEVPVEDVSAVADVATLVIDPAATMQEKEDAAHTLSRVREMLTEREYAVFLRYLDGDAYTEIAAQLHMTPKAVDNALQRARAKLRRLF
ncbi:MAG: sigma-70 family RNA polymerase sigma factor [Ruminococcaceae bacterium]|nr:sigma-70 family RNA polymerase sigma factor [Oscillospiraceae bacterium]